MRAVRFAALLVGFLSIAGFGSGAARAQALSTASKGAEIYAFGGYMPSNPDYGPHSKNGYAAGVGFSVFPRFILKPSIEIRADEAKALDVTEKTVLFGGRAQLDVKERLHPYGEFLIGGGEVVYHAAPYPDYTGDRARVYGYGVGVDIDIAHHLGAKLDLQQRNWNLGTNTFLAPYGIYTLTPRVLLVGVTYTVPFRKLNRQGDFR